LWFTGNTINHPSVNRLVPHAAHAVAKATDPSTYYCFFLAWCTISMIFSTTDGSESCTRSVSPGGYYVITGVLHDAPSPPWARDETQRTVVVSPSWSSSPAKILRMIRRMILPDRVLGKSGTTKIALGAANGPIDCALARSSPSLPAHSTRCPPLARQRRLPLGLSIRHGCPQQPPRPLDLCRRQPAAYPCERSRETQIHNVRCSISAASISAVESRWPETFTTSSTRPRIQ